MPLAIVIIPFILSYLKGKSAQQETIKAYHAQMLRTKKALPSKKALKVDREGRKLKYQLNFDTSPLERMTATFELVDRYNYGFWLAKLFKKAPSDKVSIEFQFSQPPAIALSIIPRQRKKIIDKIMDQLSEKEILDMEGLQEFIVATDRSRNAGQIFSKRLFNLLNTIKDPLYFLIVNYSLPHLQLKLELNRETANKIFSGTKAALVLAERISKIKRTQQEEQTTKFLKKSITKGIKEITENK